ncbi:MAG: CotH kinase family protein, partial [Coprobacter sp.]|nr:CotH kinase family protein [Coprobacter sp.]
ALEKEKKAIWHLPPVKISGGACLVVFAVKGKNDDGNGRELTARLKLPKEGGVVRLLAPDGSVQSEVEYGPLAPDQSLQRLPDGTYAGTYRQSPGFENTPEGHEAACARIDARRNGPLLVWEVMCRAQRSDLNWVKLKNVSDSVVDLSAYHLSRKMGKDGLPLPAKTVKPGETVCIPIAGKRGNPNGIPFKWGKAETVVLTKDGRFVDGVCARPSVYGTSVSRSAGRPGFFICPSPARNTDNGAKGRRYVAPEPQFGCKPGLYGEKELCLHLNTGGRTVHYTLDGSEPTLASPHWKDSLVITRSTVVRAFAEGDSVSLDSPVATATYLLGTDHDLAVMNISIDKEDLYDYNRGIYADGPDYSPEIPHLGANFWKKWTRNAHVEFFDGKEGFSQDCGLKIFGGFSRYEAKKSFCLKFKRAYGSSKVHYDFFGNGQTPELQDLVLRSGSQDYNRCMIRDEFFTSLLQAQSPTLLIQMYRPVALYINAEYFGLYYIREKIDPHFVASRLHVAGDSVNIIMSRGYNEVGSSVPYRQLMQYISTHDMTDRACYDYVRQQVDLQGLIDYKLGEIYSGNTDVGNIRYVRSTDPQSDRKWHFVFYDLDATWVGDNPASYYLAAGPNAAASNVAVHNIMINRLLANNDFRALFLTRLSHHMQHTFSPENTTAVFDRLVGQIRQEMKYNCERWPQLSYTQWERNIAAFREKFATRPQTVLNDLRRYLSVSEAENKQYFEKLGF